MQLYIIGPAGAGQSGAEGRFTLVLSRDPYTLLGTLQKDQKETPLAVLFTSEPLPNGWDQLAFAIARAATDTGDWDRGRWTIRAEYGELFECVQEAIDATAQAWGGVQAPVTGLGRAMRLVRTKVFGATQEVVGIIAGASSSRVSRWESGALEPGLYEVARLRAFALGHGLPWDDNLLFTQSAPDTHKVADQPQAEAKQ